MRNRLIGGTPVPCRECRRSFMPSLIVHKANAKDAAICSWCRAAEKKKKKKKKRKRGK